MTQPAKPLPAFTVTLPSGRVVEATASIVYNLPDHGDDEFAQLMIRDHLLALVRALGEEERRMVVEACGEKR